MGRVQNQKGTENWRNALCSGSSHRGRAGAADANDDANAADEGLLLLEMLLRMLEMLLMMVRMIVRMMVLTMPTTGRQTVRHQPMHQKPAKPASGGVGEYDGETYKKEPRMDRRRS